MAYVKIWLHCVWGTHNRYHFLRGDLKNKVINHILENAKQKNIRINCLNGSTEHLHCLLLLDPDRSISQIMQLLKGESSCWINKQKLIKSRFEWAVQYYAVSVSDSDIRHVQNYIRNQEEHHKSNTWEEESDKLITQYGFSEYQDVNPG